MLDIWVANARPSTQDAVRAQVEEKLACAKRLLHKVHELVEDEGHLLAIDKLKSVQGHVEERIVVLQAMLASLGGDDGGEKTMPAEPSDVFGMMPLIS